VLAAGVGGGGVFPLVAAAASAAWCDPAGVGWRAPGRGVRTVLFGRWAVAVRVEKKEGGMRVRVVDEAIAATGDECPLVTGADVAGLYSPQVAAVASTRSTTWVNGDPLADD
jgi:hypothetical protein